MAVCSLCKAIQTEERVVLKWQLKAGEHIRYAVSHSMEQSGEEQDSILVTDKITLDLSWTPRLLQEDGSARIVGNILRVRRSINAANTGAPAIEYDTDGEELMLGAGTFVVKDRLRYDENRGKFETGDCAHYCYPW